MISIVTIIASGLVLGFLGSFHCVGMCGPLAMTLPVTQKDGNIHVIKVLAYNFGRAFTYAVFGLVFGLIGNSFAFFGWQQGLSVVSGVLMLSFLLFNYTRLSETSFVRNMQLFTKKHITSHLMVKTKTSSLFIIGLLNGLLPCGLVYFAISTALATGTALNGALLMFAFGLGTMPAMAAVMVFHKFISFGFRKKLKTATPYFVTLVAVLLIVRGLNLGIPYLSPKIEAKKACVIRCCH